MRVLLTGANGFIGSHIAAAIPYLGILTFGLPELWAHPLGPLTKTVPLIVATLVMIAIEDDR